MKVVRTNKYQAKVLIKLMEKHQELPIIINSEYIENNDLDALQDIYYASNQNNMKLTFAFDMFDILEVYKEKREKVEEVNKVLRDRALYPNAEFVVFVPERTIEEVRSIV